MDGPQNPAYSLLIYPVLGNRPQKQNGAGLKMYKGRGLPRPSPYSMNKFELSFSALLVPVDLLMIIIAASAAYFIRISSFVAEIRPVIYDLSFREYMGAVFVIAPFSILIFALSGLYNLKVTRRLIQEFFTVAIATSGSLMAVIIMIFLRRELFSSRFIILIGWILSILCVTIGRFFIRNLQKFLVKKYNYGIHNVLLVGGNGTKDVLMNFFHKDKGMGYRVIESLDTFDPDQVEKIIKERKVNEIIQCDPIMEKGKIRSLIDLSEEYKIDFKFIPDTFGTYINFDIRTISGIPIVEIKRTSLDGWGKIIKRTFDIVVSLILIILLSPVLLITIIAIKIDSKGPIFFSRLDDGTSLTRIGAKGKPFRYFKFRSMFPKVHNMRYRELANQNLRDGSPLVKIKNDPRITGVGKFIRRFSIDELPELFLVLWGKMSLVGPRPHLPEEVAKYEKHHKKVLTIKPGITGLAQISGRSDLDFEEEVRLDTYYIENWNLKLDLQILFKTPLAVFSKRQAE